MIQIVTPDVAHHFGAEIDAMFRLRHRVFKEALGWAVRCENGMERDEYDDLDPVYFLAFDDHGRVLASWRMLPTDGPYMLRDVFAALLDGAPAPADPQIWEVSRFAVDLDLTNAARVKAVRKVTREMFCALGEFSLARGIRQNVCVTERRVERLMKQLGCVQSWRSADRRFGKAIALAAGWDVTEEIVAEVHRRSGISAPVWTPLVADRVAAAA